MSDPNSARARHLVAVVGTVCLLAVGGCAGVDETPEEENTDVVTAELLEEPANYAGETLAVEAVVGTVITENAFTIVTDADAVAQEDPVGGRLVVLAPRIDLEPGDQVAVEGVVHEYLPLEDLEERFGTQWTDLMGEEYGAEPYLEATSLEQVGR